MTEPVNPWLDAYLKTLVYHEQTVEALKNIEHVLWWLTCACESQNHDLQILLTRSRRGGLFGGDAKEQAEALSKPPRKKGFEVK